MSEFIYAIHDFSEEWANIIRAANKTGWAIHTEAVGRDANDRGGKSYSTQGITNVARLNNGYGKGTGVIPTPQFYDDFAKRCANFVAGSNGLDYVVIGNEIALEWEQPDDNPITLANYAQCYLRCYKAIKAVKPGVLVAPQAPAPWNNRTPDAPDWIEQLPKMLSLIGQSVDWIALHAYTKGYGLDKFNNNHTMNPPYQGHKFGWETLWEYMRSIPPAWRHLPVLVTETNGDGSWGDNHSGWIQHMYAEINSWNEKPGNQKILASALFRWAKHDEKWDMSRHGATVDDFRRAVNGTAYRHNFIASTPTPAAPVRPQLGPNQLRIVAEAGLNMRRAANRDATIITSLSNGTVVTKLADAGEWVEVTSGEYRGFVFAQYTEAT